MSLNKDGIVVILSSPSGAGKTTLVKKIAEKNSYNISISHTTRKPRTEEVDGQDYFFVSQEKFKNLVKNDEFLEYAKVFENYYGSSKKWVVENLDNDPALLYRKLYDTILSHVKPECIPSVVLHIGEYSYQSAFVVDQEITLVCCLLKLAIDTEWVN